MYSVENYYYYYYYYMILCMHITSEYRATGLSEHNCSLPFKTSPYIWNPDCKGKGAGL